MVMITAKTPSVKADMRSRVKPYCFIQVSLAKDAGQTGPGSLSCSSLHPASTASRGEVRYCDSKVLRDPACMATQPRLDLPGIPQHIVRRGNNRPPCLLDDADRHRYLHLLGAAAPWCRCSSHGGKPSADRTSTTPAASTCPRCCARSSISSGAPGTGMRERKSLFKDSAWPAPGTVCAQAKAA